MGTKRYAMGDLSIETINSKLLYITYSKFENDWPSVLHTHSFTELFCVINGKGRFQIEENEYPIQKDDFVIVNPNTPHTEKSLGPDPLEYVILGIENLSFSFEGNTDYIIFNCQNDKHDLLFYMNTMLHELESEEVNSDRICQNLLEVLIIKLIRRTNFAFDVTPSIKISKECLKIKRYIETNFHHDISLDDLAQISHLNKYYLVHVFTKRFGVSPINYLVQKRIQDSKELLASTDYSIADIAQMSGFSSQSYFAQCFMKNCGITASQYRKSCKTNLPEK
ncbi:MAG: AraC family transcriptional regulator [Hespellia sp.]|nr:AraC family transcriptional regulator [Hespellia sp.]